MSVPSSKPEPAGFGHCGECAYFQTGSTSICYRCACAGMEPLAKHRCEICDQITDSDLICGNPLCGRDIDKRGFTCVFAIAMKTGVLDNALKDYKYRNRWGWGVIFGRVVVGYLNANPDIFRRFDLIIPSPTYTDTGGCKTDHTADVLHRAQVEDKSWPFRFDIMSRALATDRLAGVERFGDRAVLAETQIRDALHVDKPRAVGQKAVLVYDDVFTDGLTMREVAYKLKAADARLVVGLVLARQPFRG
jgi:predicted amidophosphoribosyltransferase